jgi:uncharacterized protein
MLTTALYAGLLGLIFFFLSAAVISGRRKHGISLLDGGNNDFARTIRGHANFAEYVPITLILMGIGEVNGSPLTFLHVVGLALLVGRIAHAWAFLYGPNIFARQVGMLLTFAALGIAAANCIYQGLPVISG